MFFRTTSYLNELFVGKAMKKVLMVAVLVFMFLGIGVVSAKTLIAGKIYNFDYSDTIADAFVNVTCNGNSVIRNSSAEGNYAVEFIESKCDVGDYLVVYASHPDYGEGTNDWENVTDKADLESFDMNLGIANVPLVPEFGLIVGVLTLVGAVVA